MVPEKRIGRINKQDFFQVFQGSGIGNIEDNLTSADPLSYTTTIMIPGRPGKLSERLLTCKNPLHGFLWSPGPQTFLKIYITPQNDEFMFTYSPVDTAIVSLFLFFFLGPNVHSSSSVSVLLSLTYLYCSSIGTNTRSTKYIGRTGKPVIKMVRKIVRTIIMIYDYEV